MTANTFSALGHSNYFSVTFSYLNIYYLINIFMMREN